MQIHDFKVGVELPYSEDCFFVSVLSKKETEMDSNQCSELRKHSLIITSEDWKVIRQNFQENCQTLGCKQLVGQFDQLFLAIDKNLQLIPWK